MPIITGQIPPYLMPGKMRLVKLATSITPAEKPNEASKNLSVTRFTNNTANAPKVLSRVITIPPISP
ncbi:MAG: hypothetical protein MZV70_61220 [Desulfobacterales bacterium]|nr:hypothetical protein [Desulfobacterales bacterium]